MSEKATIPLHVASEHGVHPRTGEPLPQRKRDLTPQVRFNERVEAVFNGIGGLPTFNQWAAQNLDKFYKMYADAQKQAPTNIQTGDIQIIHNLPPTELDQ